jgi:hypothetical protein
VSAGVRWSLVACVAGCHFDGSRSAPAVDVDAAPAVDADPGCELHPLTYGELCGGDEQPALDLDDSGFVIDTSAGTIGRAGAPPLARCQAAELGGRDVCAAWLESLDVREPLRVIGERPLVLVVSGELRVTGSGSILAGSGLFAGLDAPGPGANPEDCIVTGAGGRGGKAPATDIFGGGGGGGLGTPGASGGAGTGGDAAAGTPGTAVTPDALRGGCPGGDGGDSDRAGRGGAGGGAVYLYARGSLRIEGAIDAAGQGGGGGGQMPAAVEGGGGGGGSGGMIVLEGELALTGSLTAGGGGGGQGGERGGGGPPGDGGDGQDGRLDGQPAAGGDENGQAAGLGGAGATESAAAVDGTSPANPDAGGGGGGGAGVILML